MKQNMIFPGNSYTFSDYFKMRISTEEVLIHISLESEITRREFLIAPIVFEVRHLSKAKLNSEFWIEYNHQLRGSLDYFLRDERNLLVVEAKNADLTRGFTQLAVEMVALDKSDEDSKKPIYGAVTTGREWNFGKLDRETKMVSQSIDSFSVPGNLEEILRILIGVLEN